MSRAARAALLLVLASGWPAALRADVGPTPPATARVAAPGAGPDLADLRAAVDSYVDEVRAAIPALQQQLKTEDAAARQFSQYLRRMHADAALQRTVLALGNTRPPLLAQAQQNWSGWEAVAHDRGAQANAVAATAKQAQQDEIERWGFLGEEGSADLAANLGALYQNAAALHARKLAVLSRLETVATHSAKDAETALALCADIQRAIAATAERVRRRFLWTRVQLADFGARLDDARTDLRTLYSPFAGASVADWGPQLIGLLRQNWVAVLTALVLSLGLGWRGRALQSGLRRRLERVDWEGLMLPRLLAAAAATLQRCAISATVALLALLVRLAAGGSAPPWSEPLLSLALAFFVWRFAYVLVGTLFDPRDSARRFAEVDGAVAAALRRRLQRLTLWLLLATVAAALVRRVGLTAMPLMLGFVVIELGAERAVYALLRDERLVALNVPLGLARWLRRWRHAVQASTVLMVGLCGFGFLNFAWYVGWGMLKSTVVLGAALLLWSAGHDLLAQRARRLRQRRVAPGLSTAWGVAVVAGLAAIAPVLWNVEGSVFSALDQVLAAGVMVGTHRVTVLRLLMAIVSIGSGWGLGRLSGLLLERRLFPRTPFDVGVRTAITTSVHYVLLVLGALLAIRVLGFDLTNLAIMAGALGVGIGFGLQALVANFVSGLVILFERPFRIGDILEHDGVYGQVRRIRKRSTVLRTLDEAELVLPNADLLAHKITNWTLSDNRARCTVTVGVAYGSDVIQVRDTLLRVAKAHPRVLDEPQVYFTAFGDSALEFRLMVWIDIRERLPVLSDLHFAIDAAFRELGIQIPFPQRDLHVHVHPGG